MSRGALLERLKRENVKTEVPVVRAQENRRERKSGGRLNSPRGSLFHGQPGLLPGFNPTIEVINGLERVLLKKRQ